MDLQTFVAETLKQIVAGVADAKSQIAELNTNAKVNPALVADDAKSKSGAPTPVEFDVALTVSHRSGTSQSKSDHEQQGLLSVVSADIGSSKQAGVSIEQQHEAVSRVKFTVRLAQPSDVETYQNFVPKMDARGRVV